MNGLYKWMESCNGLRDAYSVGNRCQCPIQGWIRSKDKKLLAVPQPSEGLAQVLSLHEAKSTILSARSGPTVRPGGKAAKRGLHPSVRHLKRISHEPARLADQHQMLLPQFRGLMLDASRPWQYGLIMRLCFHPSVPERARLRYRSLRACVMQDLIRDRCRVERGMRQFQSSLIHHLRQARRWRGFMGSVDMVSWRTLKEESAKVAGVERRIQLCLRHLRALVEYAQSLGDTSYGEYSVPLQEHLECQLAAAACLCQSVMPGLMHDQGDSYNMRDGNSRFLGRRSGLEESGIRGNEVTSRVHNRAHNRKEDEVSGRKDMSGVISHKARYSKNLIQLQTLDGIPQLPKLPHGLMYPPHTYCIATRTLVGLKPTPRSRMRQSYSFSAYQIGRAQVDSLAESQSLSIPRTYRGGLGRTIVQEDEVSMLKSGFNDISPLKSNELVQVASPARGLRHMPFRNTGSPAQNEIMPRGREKQLSLAELESGSGASNKTVFE